MTQPKALSRFPSSRNSRDIKCFRLQALLWIAISLALLHPQSALSQTDTASISGSIVDSSGAVIAGAAVQLTNNATGQKRATSANSAGVYSIPNILPGSYKLTVKKTGFEASTLQNIQLQVQEAFKQNVTLTVGSLSESVTVSDQASQGQIQTENHEVSQGFHTRELVQLPTSGRNILSIATLAPGNTPATNTQGNAGDSGFFGTNSNQIAVTGLPDTSTVFLQDGVENVNLLTQTMNIVPSIESVEEVITTINGAPARYADPSVINREYGKNWIQPHQLFSFTGGYFEGRLYGRVWAGQCSSAAVTIRASLCCN